MINLDSFNNNPDAERFKKIINPDYQSKKEYKPIDLLPLLGFKVKLILGFDNNQDEYIIFNTKIESISSEYFSHIPIGYDKSKRFTSYHLIKSIELL